MENKKNQTSHDGANIYLLALLSALVVQLIGSIVILALGDMSGRKETLVNLLFMALIQGAFFLTLFSYEKKSGIERTFKVKRISVTQFILCVLCALVVMIGFVLPAQWFAFGLEKIGYAFSSSLVFDDTLTIILGFIVMVLLAPVVEEMIFRGALLGSLIRKTSKTGAVIVCGLAFSLMHMNPEQTVYQFFLGCACSYLVLCSGNLLCSIVLHASSNFLAFLLMLVPSSSEASYALPYPVVTACLTVALAVVGGIIIMLLGKKLIANSEKKKTLRDSLNALTLLYRSGEERTGFFGKKGHIVALALGFGISSLMWIVTFIGSII